MKDKSLSRLLLVASALLFWAPFQAFAGEQGAQVSSLERSYAGLGKRVKSVRIAGLKRVEPGKDVQPAFSDPGRVQAILKVLSDVYYGRPLPYPKDGTVFGNREGRLPSQPKGYYKEYTVTPPPGSPLTLTVGDRVFQMQPPNGTRGAERLILGAGDEAYYTPDHYNTFIRLAIVR